MNTKGLKNLGGLKQILAIGQPSAHARLFGTACVFLLLFAVVLSLQWLSGCLTAELSGYPDEAAHYLSGLLVRDYLATGVPSNPLRFAQGYYLRYPYFAIGHWPPMFYALEGVWMLLFSPSRVSVLILMALITAALACTTYRVLRREFGSFAALAAALFMVFLPLVQRFSGMVMLDTLFALLSFWAILAFCGFLESGRWQEALKFGVLSSLAILTKGNAFYLALVPPIAVLLGRRFDLVKRPLFWLPAAAVLLLSLPWHLITMRLMLPTFVYTWGTSFTEAALRFYGNVLWKTLGTVVLVLAIIGLATRTVETVSRKAGPIWNVLAATLFSLAIFYCVVPAGTEARYVIAALPYLLIFFVAGADYVAGILPVSSRVTARNCVILLAIAVFATTSFEMPRKASFGFRQAAERLAAEPDFANGLSLVSSDSNLGEGLLISEIAMRGRHQNQTILRGSKVLADNDWNDTYYRARYNTPEALMQCLERSKIQFLILDVSTQTQHKSYEHHQQLLWIVNTRRDRWQLTAQFPAEPPAHRTVRIYRALGAEGRPSPSHLNRPSINTDHWPILLSLNCDGSAAYMPQGAPQPWFRFNETSGLGIEPPLAAQPPVRDPGSLY